VLVTNNDGTLSNGGKLTGWRNSVYFLSYGLAWLAACGVTTVAIIRLWPAKDDPEPPHRPDRPDCVGAGA
jgi:hypothetical protein